MADIKWSQFPSAIPGNSDEVVGLHSGDNARFTIANIVAAVRNGLANLFVPKTDVGAAGGVASLDSTGKVPGTQLDLSGKQDKITASGILKGDGQGGVSAATPGTDYQAPLTAGTDYATPAQLTDKAAKADLTNIQATGTTNTTGAVIPAGAYFYLNGILHQAKTQIDQNATFTVNTNCIPTTVGSDTKYIYRLVYDSSQQCFPVTKVPKDIAGNTAAISFIARNNNTGAIYVVWYRNASQGFVIGSTISGAAPANGDPIFLLY